jgi:uncharacterized protein (DUF58 family)
LRHLDWRAFARSDRFYIKEYEQETNLQATVAVDLSGSMAYTGKAATRSKADYARALARSLAALLIRQQDAVGAVTFDTKIRSYIPARSRVSHLRVILNELEQGQPGGETDLGDVFHALEAKLHRRGLLIIISDCFGDVASFLKAMAHFRHAHPGAAPETIAVSGATGTAGPVPDSFQRSNSSVVLSTRPRGPGIRRTGNPRCASHIWAVRTLTSR